MRQSLVNRSVIALSSVLVLACAGFAWVVEHPTRTAPASLLPGTGSGVLTGAVSFEARCARCHDIDEAAAPLVEPADPQLARAGLLAFLARHRKSDPAENAAIVEYLEAEAVARQQPAPENDSPR